MKGFIYSITKIIVLLCIFAFTVSCIGKREPADEERNQNNEAAATEQEMASAREQALAGARERAIAESDWQFNPGFISNHQLDDETMRLVEDYIEDYYGSHSRVVLDCIQYVKIPAQGWGSVEPIVFAADFSDIKNDRNGNIHLLIFYKEDGRIYSHDTNVIGWSFDGIDITNGRELNYDYIEDLPGRRIGSSSAFVGDFNQDGYDEIVLFGYDPENPFTGIILFSMLGFTDGTRLGIGFVPIFEARIQPGMPWDVRTWELGPPIQFGTYKGTEGFVIYEHTPTGFTTFISDTISGYPDEVTEYIDQWNFYAWDAEEEQYVFIDQLVPNEIKTQWQNVKK